MCVSVVSDHVRASVSSIIFLILKLMKLGRVTEYCLKKSPSVRL